MQEYLAIPAWQARPTRLDAWVAQLEGSAGPVVLTREGSDGAWIEVAALRLRGYVLIENGFARAINFELHDPDPEPATTVLQAAVEALNWELHEDDDDEDDDDDDEDPDEDDDD